MNSPAHTESRLYGQKFCEVFAHVSLPARAGPFFNGVWFCKFEKRGLRWRFRWAKEANTYIIIEAHENII